MSRMRPPYSLRSVLFASGAVSVVVAALEMMLLVLYDSAVKTWALTYTLANIPIGRVRDVGFLWLFRQASLHFEFDPAPHLPAMLNHSFELRVESVFQWLPPVLVTNLFAAWLLVLALYAIAFPISKIFPKAVSRLCVNWLTSERCALLILVACTLPVFIHSYDFLFSGAAAESAKTSLVAILFIVPNFLLVLILRLWNRKQLHRFLRTCIFCGAATLGFALVAAVTTQALKETRPQPVDRGLPNILLVSIDSLRSDHLHCYGYPERTSPRIDQLAAEGVLFETVAAPTSWTLPSHVTLLTALAPEEHRVAHHASRLSSEAVTLAEALRAVGYTTAGFVSGAYMDASYGFYQGFDHYNDYTASAPPILDWPLRDVTSPTLLGLVRTWLTGWSSDSERRPFFVFLHMFDVHYDYVPPRPYDQMFDPDYDGTITAENFLHSKLIHKDTDPRDLEHVTALYDGEIRYTDHYLGKVFDLLNDLGEWGNTLTVVTADHGDEFFEHGEKGHHKALYDESILVPLVMRFSAKISAGRRVKQQVRLMDVAPTILHLAGIPETEGFGGTHSESPHSGRDLSELILGDPTMATEPLVAFGELWITSSAYMRTDTAKVILDLEEPDNIQVYDLRSDPREQQNLAGQNSTADNALRQQLMAWRDLQSGRPGLAEKMTPTGEQLEVLRSLGYIQ